jgi:invasion protein IalB
MAFYRPNIPQCILAIVAAGRPSGMSGRISARLPMRFWLLVLCLAGVFQADFARAQVTTRGNFGDWSLRCEPYSAASSISSVSMTMAPPKESCALMQSFADEKRPELTLTVMILRHLDTGKFILRVLAPLNVNLIRRLGLKIDKVDLGRADFTRCDRMGCLADVPFDDMLFNQFKSGQIGVFTYFMAGRDMLPNGEGVGFPLNLVGFDAGMASIPEIR